MHLRRSLTVLLIFVCAGCGQQGAGEGEWVEQEETVRSYAEQYISADGVNYAIASKRWDMQYVTQYSDGEVETETEIDTQLPDMGAGEYDRIRLARRGETVVLTVEFKYFYEDGSTIESRSQGDLELVSGTWADYAQGKVVQVRFTDASHEQRTRDRRREIADQYDSSTRELLLEELSYDDIDPDRVSIETSVDRFDLDNEPFTLSRSAIKWGYDKPLVTTYKASYSIN